MEIARKRAVEIVSDYSHAGLADDGGECGENAQDYRRSSAATLMSRWIDSPSHYRNILTNGTRIGVGVYVLGNRMYAVQNFK